MPCFKVNWHAKYPDRKCRERARGKFYKSVILRPCHLKELRGLFAQESGE